MSAVEKSRQILVVDDDAPMLRIMRLSIQMAGFTAVVAASRDEAIGVVEQSVPDLILMDYRMSGLAPEAFIDSVRNMGFEGPIVLCTAMDEELNLEVDEVIRKPFSPEVLMTRLRELLA